MISEYFTICFNRNIPPFGSGVSPDLDNVYDLDEEFLFTTDEIFYFLTSLDMSKSSGPDRISACMLKSTANSIVPSVTILFNLSLQSGRILKGWKQSMIVPIPKNSPANSPKDYTPISLLGILSKVLHSIISQHLAQHHPLSNSQWGFQSGKSTVSALLTTVDSYPVWIPYLKKDMKQLEDVEKFALKTITMQWDLGYQDLLRISDISLLQSR